MLSASASSELVSTRSVEFQLLTDAALHAMRLLPKIFVVALLGSRPQVDVPPS